MTPMTLMDAALHERWYFFARSLGHDTYEGANAFEKVLRPRYSEGHRAYHTLEHIYECFRMFDKHVPLDVKDRKAIELAIWFHDVVYETSAQASLRNELESSTLLLEEGTRMGFPKDLIELASAMVLATKTHEPPKNPPEALAYFLDVDMSILGQKEEAFDKYEAGVRFEWKWVPDNLFNSTRSGILQKFLDFEWIYNTRRFRQHFEGEARANIHRALLKLGAP